MAKLLQHTSSLVIKIDGKFDIPTEKKSKTVTVKKLFNILQTESSEILYAGYDFDKPFTGPDFVEDCLLITIHIIEDPITINYNDNTQGIVKHFVKNLKKNTSRILLQNSRTQAGKQERQFEFYVRGIANTAKSIGMLKQA